MAHDVFISYSTRDKATADAVVARLEAVRLRCWVAPRDIVPGMEWGEAIVDGIHRARVMVLIFSSSANASPQIRREVERAVNHGLPIVPFRIEEILPSRSLEYFLSSPHWLDALTKPVDAHINRLSDSVRTLLSRMDGIETAAAPRPTPSAARAKVRKVLATVLGRRTPLVNAGKIAGLAAPPGPPRKPGARPARPAPPAPIGLIVAVGVLFLIAIGVFLLPRRAVAPRPAVALPRPTAAPVPAAAPSQNPPTPRTTLESPSRTAAASPAVSSDTIASRQRAPRVRASYECRRGVKFSIDPDQATVTMDGRRIGIARDFYHDEYNLRPGTHYAKLSLRGYRTDTLKIVVHPGAEDDNVDIKLEMHRSY